MPNPWLLLVMFSRWWPKINLSINCARTASTDWKCFSIEVGDVLLEHRNSCTRLLLVATKDFVDQLFDVISNRKYISDGKKVRKTSLEKDVSERIP